MASAIAYILAGMLAACAGDANDASPAAPEPAAPEPAAPEPAAPEPAAPDAPREMAPESDDRVRPKQPGARTPPPTTPDEPSPAPDGPGAPNMPSDEGEPAADPPAEPAAPEPGDGTLAHPHVIAPPLHHVRGDTCAGVSEIDTYPPAPQDESGPEVVYAFTLDHPATVDASLAWPEPAGVDADVHLLTDAVMPRLIARDDTRVRAALEPGRYLLIVDTFAGPHRCGAYDLRVELTRRHAGTVDDPVWLGGRPDTPLTLPFRDLVAGDTSTATSDAFDVYPPHPQDESGPEVIYAFTIDARTRFMAAVEWPAPPEVDIDLHLLGALDPATVIDRDHRAVYTVLEPGTYYLVADTWVGARPLAGSYQLHIAATAHGADHEARFDPYVMAAVDYLFAEYGLLGYGAEAVLTHPMDYGPYGTIGTERGQRTMCVSAMLEVMLQAMTFYAEDTGDDSVWDYLPLEAWTSFRLADGELDPYSFRAHLWVHHELGTWGSADAFEIFGMGHRVPFEALTPGAFINFNTRQNGHAVVFVAYVDAYGHELSEWSDRVVGFKYFSSQGGWAEGSGGFDLRYAIFEAFGETELPIVKEPYLTYGVIASDDPRMLNTGVLLRPNHWGADRAPPRAP